MPLPVAANKGMINEYKQDAPSLRLLFSLTGGSNKAVWEDLTGSTQLSLVNNCVSFTTTVSARFWLVDCRQNAESTKFANLIYQKAIEVPFLVKFITYAKQVSLAEYELRMFILTDDKEEKTLEQLENYVEIAKSKLVEIGQYSTCYLEFAGNFKPIASSSEQLQMKFEAFRENRLPCRIKIKNMDAELVGRVAFMREKRRQRTDLPQTPICNLNIILPHDPTLPEEEPPKLSPKRDVSSIKLNGHASTAESSPRKQIESPRKQSQIDFELHPTLTKVSTQLDRDWTNLALHLNVPEQLVDQLANEPDLNNQERAAYLLQYWQNNLNADPRNPSENVLENALRRINREDIIYKAILNINQIEEQIIKPEPQRPLYADIQRPAHTATTYEPFSAEEVDMDQEEPEFEHLEEPVPIRYEDRFENISDSNRYAGETSPQLVELTEGFTIEQQHRQSVGDLLERESHVEEFGPTDYQQPQYESDFLGQQSSNDFLEEEPIEPHQSSQQQTKSRQELPDSIVESQETIEDTGESVIHTVTQTTKTTIIQETEEPASSSLIQFDQPAASQFEPQDFNEVQPELISSTYYQRADDETDDLKMHVEQKEESEIIAFPELWFEQKQTIDTKNSLGVPMTGRPKALSERNLNIDDDADETFVFSTDFIRELKEQFSNASCEVEKEWIEEDDDGATHHIIEQKTICTTKDSKENEDETLASYTQKKDYFQNLSKDSKVLPVPRSWSASEEQIQQADDQTTSRKESESRSLSTSATLSENEQFLIKRQSNQPEQRSSDLSSSGEISSDNKDLVTKQDIEERRSSIVEEIPEFRERVEYFRRMSKEESIEDTSIQSSNSSSQFTPNTAKRVAGKIVFEVQKRVLEQFETTSSSEQEEGESSAKMSKTSDQEQTKNTSQEEDVDLSVSAHWYSSDSVSSKQNFNHSKLQKQDHISEQDVSKKYDSSKFDELSHKIKRARYSDEVQDSDLTEKATEEITSPSSSSKDSSKSIQSLFRSQSLESSKQQQAQSETARKLSLKDATNMPPTTNVESAQSRQWFKPPLPSTKSKLSTGANRKTDSIEEVKENLEAARQYRSASLGKEGIFQFTQKSLSSSLQALVSGKLNESSFNTLERALNIIRAYDLQNVEPDNSIYELLDAIDDQDFKKAVPLANSFLDDEYKKLLSSVDLLDEEFVNTEKLTEQETDLDKLHVSSDQTEMKKQSSFERQQLELQQLEESVDIDELIDLIPDEQSILSKKFRESDLVLLRKLRSIEEDESPVEEQQNKESTLSQSDKLTVDLNLDFNNNLTSIDLSDYLESQSSVKLDISIPSRSPVSEILALLPQPKLEYRQNASIQTEKSFLLTQRMQTINAIVKEISRPEFVEDALCSSPTRSSPTYSCSVDSQSLICDCPDCMLLKLDENNNTSPKNVDNTSLLSFETCASLITSCSDDYCKRKQSLQSEIYFTCSEGSEDSSVSRCSTCTSLNSLENKMMIDKNSRYVEPSSDERPISVCESSTSTITSRSTLDSVEAATAAVESGLIALIAGELTLLLGELTLKFEMSKRLEKEFDSSTTSESEVAKKSINDQYEQLIREHLAPIYDIYGKELPDNCIAQLIGDYCETENGNYLITEKDIQPEQLALRTQEMLRHALPIKKKLSNKSKVGRKMETKPELFSPEESEGIWVQTFKSSGSDATSKREMETQTSEEDFSESNSDSLFGQYLMMDNEKLLNQKPLLLDVDDFVNYLVSYCTNATNESNEKNQFPPGSLKPALNVKDVMIKLRKNPKFVNFLNRINGQLRANANNEIITNHDLLLEMVTDQCKDELIDILKEVISCDLHANIIENQESGVEEFNPTLLDSIPEEDSDELISRGSTLTAKQINLYKEQQKAVEKWLAASLDNLAVYAQQNVPFESVPTTLNSMTDSQSTLLPNSKEDLNKAIAETERSLELLIKDEEFVENVADQIDLIPKTDRITEKVSVIKMPIITQEFITVCEEEIVKMDSKNDEQKNKEKNMSLDDEKLAISNDEKLAISNDEKSQSKDSPLQSQTGLDESPKQDVDMDTINEIKKEAPKISRLDVPNAFTRLAISLDEGSSDEEDESSKRKLEKTHSLPEDEFTKKTLNDIVEMKNQPNMHLTSLDLSQIQQQTDAYIQEEVLSNFFKDLKRPKLQYQFASEDDLYTGEQDMTTSFDENLDDSNYGALREDTLQDSIFDNLNLMETIEESFDEDENVGLNLQTRQNQEKMILAQQKQLNDYEQQLIEQQIQMNQNEQRIKDHETMMNEELEQQQQIFANELMELQKEFANIYSQQQEQYFEELQKINQENLEIKLEQLLNLEGQKSNLPVESNEVFANQEANEVFANQESSSKRMEDLEKESDGQQVQESDLCINEQKSDQKSLSTSLSDDKEKSTSSDTSVVTEILNESFQSSPIGTLKVEKPQTFETILKVDNIITYGTVPEVVMPKQKTPTEVTKKVEKNEENLSLKKHPNLDIVEVEENATSAYHIENDDELDDITDQLLVDENLNSIDLQDLNEDLELIENIAQTLEDLVTEANPTSSKKGSLAQAKNIDSALMEEIAKTLNDLLIEAKQVLGDNQITLSSQKLNKTSKQKVIESITSTLENLLIIDEEVAEKPKLTAAKNVRRNLIQTITKSLESLLTDSQQAGESNFPLKSLQQRSFDHEPKLNIIITRSLENLLTLSDHRELYAKQPKKRKKQGVLESITKTLENLFTKSQPEIEQDNSFNCTCKVTLENKKFEYNKLTSATQNGSSDLMDKFAQQLENLIEENDKVSLKSIDSSKQSEERPAVPKRSKKLKMSEDQSQIQQDKADKQTSFVTILSPEIIEEKRIWLPELQADVEMIESPFETSTIEPDKSSRTIEIQNEELSIEPVETKKSIEEQVPLLSERQTENKLIESSSSKQSPFVIEEVNLPKAAEKDPNKLRKESHKPEMQIQAETNKIEANLIHEEIANETVPIAPVDKKLTSVECALVNSDLLKTEFHHVPADLMKLPILITEKTSDLIRTDYFKSDYLKVSIPKAPIIVFTTKTSEFFKTDYHYVPEEQETKAEQIEIEKIEDQDRLKNKRLKLKMPVYGKESILIRQSQIDDDEQDTSDVFDVKLITSDDEPFSPEDQSIVLKSKSTSEAYQKSEQSEELNLTNEEQNRKLSTQSDKSEYAEAKDDTIEVDEEKLREQAGVVRKKSVRFQSPDVVKDVRLFTPGSSQEIEFYDADDSDEINFGQQAILDLIERNSKSSINNETDFDRESLNTLIEKQPKQSDEKRKDSLTGKGELEVPQELLELLRKPSHLLTEKEKAKLKKLSDKYEEKSRKLKEKQEAKLKKEQEKQEKARKKEEEKLKKQEEKIRKEEEKKMKKSKEEQDKKSKKSKDAKNNNLENLKSESLGQDEIRHVEQEIRIEESKVDLKNYNKTDDLPQILSQETDSQNYGDSMKLPQELSEFSKNEQQILSDEDLKNAEKSPEISIEDSLKIRTEDLKPEKISRTKKLSKKESAQKMQTEQFEDSAPENEKVEFSSQKQRPEDEREDGFKKDESIIKKLQDKSTKANDVENSTKDQTDKKVETFEQKKSLENKQLKNDEQKDGNLAMKASLVDESQIDQKMIEKSSREKSDENKLKVVEPVDDTKTIAERKEEKVKKKAKISKKLNNSPDSVSNDLKIEESNDRSIAKLQDNQDLEIYEENLVPTNANLLEMESIRGLSSTAKLNNKLFKKSLDMDDSSEAIKSVNLNENLPLIILPQNNKSATLDDRLLRRNKSSRLTSIDQLDFHHLDNVGCIDSSIKSYFNNFIRSDNLCDLKDINKRRSEYKERRPISPTSTSHRIHNLSVESFGSNALKRHTISAKRTPPMYLDNLRAQLNTLSNAELSFFANQIKENKIKPPPPNQFELINKSLLSSLHHSSELSVSTPCLSEIIRSHPRRNLPNLILPYVSPSINRHLSGRSRLEQSAIQKLSPIQMPLLNIPLHLKTESMPSLSRVSSVNRSFVRQSIRTTARTSYLNLYKDTSDVYYRDTLYQLKRIEEQLNRLKRQFDSTANLSKVTMKSRFNDFGSRKMTNLPSPTYKYHCTINLSKNEVEVKPMITEDIHSEPSRTKIYFRIYKQLGCNHVGSKDLTCKIKEHEDEFMAFCPPYVCVLCYYTVISIHFLMKQGYEMNVAIEMVKKKQDKEKEEKFRPRSSAFEIRNRSSTSYLPSRCSSPLKYSGTSNVCHQATTHLNHQQHYSYERCHKPRFYYRDQYLDFKCTLDDRPKSPSSLRVLDCSSPTSAVNKNACKSLYHSSYRTNYSNSRFQSDYMKRKSRIDPFLKDTNVRKAEILWRSKNNF